ncbi:unnamed protein product [Pylaiella littoralis]
MKFGKNIGRVVELSDPEWSPFWINYKFLKKKAKALEDPSAKLVAPDQRSDPKAMAQSAGEVEFYRLLRQELKKCSEFFTGVEAQLTVRQARVNEGWRQLLLPNVVVEGNPNKRLMAACVKLYKDLLLLENFAIMNYCGFSKILKKHDKLTGFRTRESFMKNVVNQAPFVQYPKVIKMLSAVEILFKNIESLPSASAEAGARVPLREEQLFIDTMLNINKDAFRLQLEEGADIGLNTPEFSHKRDGFKGEPSATTPVRAAAAAAAAAAVVSSNGRGVTAAPRRSGNNIAEGGLDMVVAAAAVQAQVVSRDSDDSGSGGAGGEDGGRRNYSPAGTPTVEAETAMATAMTTTPRTTTVSHCCENPLKMGRAGRCRRQQQGTYKSTPSLKTPAVRFPVKNGPGRTGVTLVV